MRVWLLATLLALGTTVTVRTQAEPAPAGISRQGQLQRSPPFSTLNGFVENRGQWPAEVRFFASCNGIDATLIEDALVLRPQPDLETGAWLPPLVLRFPAAQSLQGEGALPTAHHFIRAESTASYVPGFQRVIYREVVPGIDLVVRIDGPWFAYDLHVAPGAELDELRIEVEGTFSHEVVAGGVLAMETDAGRIEQRIGAAWETDSSGAEIPVKCSFRTLQTADGRTSFGFEASDRDESRPFVLDPSLVYATYVGGLSQELLKDIHVDSSGAVYLAVKASPGTPTTPGAFQSASAGFSDAWVGRLSPDGSALDWGTYLGSSGTDEPFGIDVNEDGTVIISGDTYSADFPASPGSLQPNFAGDNDMFVARLSADGSDLVWSTFYGGPQSDHATASAVFANGDVLLAGVPDTSLPPATPGSFDGVFDSGDQMLVRISADGTKVVFQTYFRAGTSAIAVEGDSHIYLAGFVTDQTAPHPATSGAFKEAMIPGDPQDGFVAKMDSMGTVLRWATYFGGDDSSDTVVGLAVDAASAVYVAGLTTSTDFPVTPGAFDISSSNDGGDGFVAKLFPGGTDTVWSTYISACCGGASQMFDLAVDTAGNVIAVGRSNEPNFPTTPDAFQPTYIGGFPASDAHLTKFDVFGEALVYSTYFGGSGSDSVPFVGLDPAQDPLIGLRSSSGNIPITGNAYDGTYAGSTDTVVAKFDLDLLPWLVKGGGLPGAVDTPNLAGTGALTPGSPARLSVRGGAPSSPASIIVGLAISNVPFKGGTMVPFPTLIVTLATNAQGNLDLPFTWANVPPGIHLYMQVWIKDLGAPTGFSATNALRMTSS